MMSFVRRTAGGLLVWLLCVIALAPVSAQEQELSKAELKELLKVKIRSAQHMALNPVMVRAAKKQNSTSLSADEIRRRDEEWSSTKELTAFKSSLQTTPAGSFLKQQIERSANFNEAFLTDNQGANVAAYPATSDYWQGDEEKWQASYNGGAGQIFIGPLEYDDSSNKFAVQISAPVLDRGRTIGVLVVGVSLDYLKRKQR